MRNRAPKRNGLIGLDASSVKLELATTTEGTVGGGVSAAGLPAGGAVVGLGASASRVTTDSQTLTISSDVLLSSRAVDYADGMLKDAPIAATMANFWDVALEAGDQVSDVCLRLKSGEGNTFKIAITVVEGVKGNVSILLAPATLTANGELKSTTGNTITVTFAPHNSARQLPTRPRPPRRGDPADRNVYQRGIDG